MLSSWLEFSSPAKATCEIESSAGFIPAAGGLSALWDANQMDDHESISIIMMLALWPLVGVITLICWLRAHPVSLDS